MVVGIIMEHLGSAYISGLGYVSAHFPKGEGVGMPESSSVYLGSLYSYEEYEFLCAYRLFVSFGVYAGPGFWSELYYNLLFMARHLVENSISTPVEYSGYLNDMFWGDVPDDA
jgi:hypothetical protein